MKCVVVEQVLDVEAALANLGLELEPLCNVPRAWYLAYTICTKNHPRTFRGYFPWGEAVRALRDYAVPKGWSASEEMNYPLTVHPAGSICIAVTTGDDGTGLADRTPTNKVRKGTQTAGAVAGNTGQMRLFSDEDLTSLPEAVFNQERKERTTYILLLYRDSRQQVVRSELSIPTSMNSDGRINSWKERILLPAVPFDGTPIDFVEPNEPDLDIEIKRRA